MKSLVLNASLTLFMVACPVAFASVTQTAGQGVKRAGQDVSHASKAVGRKVKDGADRVVHRGAKSTEKGASRVKDKTKI